MPRATKRVCQPSPQRASGRGSDPVSSGQSSPLLTPHDTYLALGESDATRQVAYRAWVTDTVDDAEWSELRQHTQQQRAWGSDRFRQQVEALTLRAATVRPRGRPRKLPATEEK